MDRENELCAQLLPYAVRVARAMWKDPEAESIAGFATLKGVRSFDPTRNVPIERWIARRVRLSIWYHWRERAKRGPELHDTVWFEEVYELATIDEHEPDIDLSDWKMLYEHHVEGCCTDVLADRYGVPVKWMRQMLVWAEARLAKECNA
jgi:hypothetical protein